MLNSLKKMLFICALALSLSVLADSDGRKDALVIIDMQAKFATRDGNHTDPENIKKLEAIEKAQKEAIKMAKAAKIPIILIEYENYGETNPELKKEIGDYKEVKTFLKDADGMFESYNKFKSSLVEYLQSKDIGNLIILGANGGACVQSSIQGALQEDYSVYAYQYGIADFNYKQFIYPYNKYGYKPTNCKKCKFRESDDLNVIALEVSGGTKKKEDAGENDTSRNLATKKPNAADESAASASNTTANK